MISKKADVRDFEFLADFLDMLSSGIARELRSRMWHVYPVDDDSWRKGLVR